MLKKLSAYVLLALCTWQGDVFEFIDDVHVFLNTLPYREARDAHIQPLLDGSGYWLVLHCQKNAPSVAQPTGK